MGAMLKAAVIGAGRMGGIHANGYFRHPRARLVGICDVDGQRAQSVASLTGVESFTNLGQMLETARPDVVSICTDAAHHLETVLAALEAGAHVLCEKPMSGNVADIQTMIEAAARKRLQLGASFNHRFARVAQKAREYIDGGEVGEICFVNMWLTIAVAAEVSEYFHLRSLHGHSFDMMRYLAGDIAKVHGFLSKPAGRTYYSNCAVGMTFKSGAVGTLIGSYDMSNLHPMERVEVGGTKARLVLENVTAGLTCYRHNCEQAEVWIPSNYTRHVGQSEYDFNLTVEHRIDAFVRTIIDGAADPAPAEHALAATRVIEATIRSFESGCVTDV
ncbi:MAG: gfo/Idh/MocA family oxidoreductase [Spirochaetaceae bacterium]|nr:MAG: gfo/Idh/MocA family oxidoreductase [Spirochaetaceae bacterium]